MARDGTAVRALTTNSNSDSPRWSAKGGIVFRSRRDGNAEIYVMGANGANPRRLTNEPADDETPAWSPDGMRIAFASRRDGIWKIMTMTASGEDIQCVQRECGRISERLPAFSPDGRRIAYLRTDGRQQALFVAETDGTGARQLAQLPPAGASRPHWLADGRSVGLILRGVGSGIGSIQAIGVDAGASRRIADALTGDDMPAWSPDGRSIVLSSGDRNGTNVVVMNADGSDRRPLTTDGPGVFNGWASWAQDKIVYGTTRGAAAGSYRGALEIMTASGGGPTPLPTRATGPQCPAFSPDARHVAFQGQTDPHNTDIFLINADGTGERRLTDDPGLDETPAWSPDGRLIAFQSDRSGTMKVYLMRADGSGVRRLTNEQ